MAKLLGGTALIAVALFMLMGFFNVSRPLSAPAAIATLLFTVGLPGAAGLALAEIELTDAGLIVYTFPDVQKLPGKGTSRDVLEA